MKYLFIGMGTGAVIVGLIILSLVFGPNTQSNKNKESGVVTTKADKVQVYLFHATQRCTTCIAIGRLAGETVNEFFQPEIKNGQVEFREINIDLPENKELALKFQASGSSLFINAISNEQDNISEDINVWRLTQDETQFKSYLKNKLDNFLGK